MAAILKGLAINKGLLGYWPLGNKGTVKGNVAVDLSGRRNNGTLVGSPPLVNGITGQALSLNGSSQFVNFGAPLSLTGPPLVTISAWINPPSLVFSGGPIIFGYNKSNGVAWGLALSFLNSNNVEFVSYNSGWYSAYTSTSSLTVGAWN